MQHHWLVLALIQSVIAHPTLLAVREDKKFEWTALGDSYASGVGSANYVDGRRCLRYDQAWPVMMNGDKTWEKGDYIFNNVPCSGSHYNEVEKYQFYDEEHTNQPNFQYSMHFHTLCTSGQGLIRIRSTPQIWESADGYPRYWW